MGDLYQMGLPILLSAEGGRSFDLLSPDPGLIFWTVLTFVGLLFLLRKTAWGPIIDGLDRREQTIRNSLADAEKAMAEGKQLLEEQDLMVIDLWATGESPLERMFNLIQMGDFVSYYLAIMNETDPTPVEAIENLKEELAKGVTAE